MKSGPEGLLGGVAPAERRSGPGGKISDCKKARFNPNSASGLLKWLNSLYRPAMPEGIRGHAGPTAFRPVYWGVAKW
jgi:hypothetical protein